MICFEKIADSYLPIVSNNSLARLGAAPYTAGGATGPITIDAEFTRNGVADAAKQVQNASSGSAGNTAAKTVAKASWIKRNPYLAAGAAIGVPLAAAGAYYLHRRNKR